MISSWDIRLQEQVRRKFKNYKIISLDLGKANINKEFQMPGNCLQVISASSHGAIATVKLNINTNEPIELIPYRKIETVFTKFFINNEVQTGESIDFIVGIDFGIQDFGPDLISTTQPAKIITNAAADTNTVGPNQICDIVLIKADVLNAGVVWVDFGTAAVQNNCLPLDPGDWTRHRITNLNQINANFEIANEQIIVVPEV